MDGLEINRVQAMIINEMLRDVSNDSLFNFLAFRTNYIEPMHSKELITKNALFDFRKIQMLQSIENGVGGFAALEDVKQFCKTYFKGQDLCYGAANYYDYVIIAMDKDGNLINKFDMRDGFYQKLNSFEEQEVYSWLFENQKRIGTVKTIPYKETKRAVGTKKEDNIIGDKVLNLIKGSSYENA